MYSEEDIARVCHETNKAFCETIGDNSQTSWDFAPQWQKDSARKGVEFNLANPTAPASASHDSWLAEKQATGWQYGVTKDEVAKTHPCYVPYEQLPMQQRTKDYLFIAIVAAMNVTE